MWVAPSQEDSHAPQRSNQLGAHEAGGGHQEILLILSIKKRRKWWGDAEKGAMLIPRPGRKREELENDSSLAQSEVARGKKERGEGGQEGGASGKMAAGADCEPGLCVDSQHIA